MKESSIKNKLAFIVIFLIVIIHLFPCFLGKVDTPIDIRDVLMYPWRYHAVDKKIETFTLWELNSSKEICTVDNEKKQLITSLKVDAGKTRDFVYKINLNKKTTKKLSKKTESNYYVTFDFKPVTKIGKTVNFKLLLINNVTKETFVPNVAVSPVLVNNKRSLWYKAYFNLNNLIKDLYSYSLCITILNNDLNNPAFLYISDLKISCDDYSKVVNIHNPSINDLIQMFTPFREYFSKSIKKGKLPFWNNYIFSGTEFIAEPQVGYFHPVYFLIYFLFDHFTAHLIVLFLSLLLCGTGAFLLARYWGLGISASLLTAIVYIFQPFNVTWMSYEHMLMNSATVPFLILAYEKNLKEDKILNKYLLISALLLGLIFLSGHLQYIHYTSIFFILFAVFRGISTRLALTKQIFSIVFVFGIGIMIGAIVLIPFVPIFQNSHRVPNSDAFINANSLPLRVFLGLIYPFHRGFPKGAHFNETYMQWALFREYIYFGLLPFVFSLFTLQKLKNNNLVIFLYLAIIFSILIFTGSPVFFLIKNFIPGFKEMQHYRFVEVYSYCVPFLSGIGFQVFLNNFPLLRQSLKNILISLVIFITVIDLLYYSSFFVTWSDRKDYKPLPKNGSLEFLIKEQKKSKEPFRILPFSVPNVDETHLKVNVSQPNTLLPYKIEEASGYSSFVPKDIYNLFVYIQTKDPSTLYPKELIRIFLNPNIPFPIYNFKSKILDLLNIKYFLIPSIITIEPQYATKVFDGDCSVYENKGFLPRAFTVSDYKVINSPKDIIQELDSETFDPLKTVILMTEPPVVLNKSEVTCNGSGHITFINYDQDNIKLKVKVNQAAFLILGNNLNNNWRVKINGKKTEHIQANLIQRAVYLPQAGDYLIEFCYYSKLFLIGLFVTCFTFFILGLLALLLNKQAKIQ